MTEEQILRILGPDTDLAPERLAELAANDGAAVRAALTRINPDQAAVLELYGGGLLLLEIPSWLEISPGTCRSRYSRGRQALKEELGLTPRTGRRRRSGDP